MRISILAMAAFSAGCGTQPAPDARTAQPKPASQSAPASTQGALLPPVRLAQVGKPDCARLIDPCRMGERGTPAERCFELTGYLDDKNGRTVYAEPDAKSRALGRVLGPFRATADYSLPISFEIIDGHDGWIRIRNAGDDPQLIETTPRKMYDGAGWIRGEGVSVTFQGHQLFARPDWTSDMTVLARDSFDSARMTALIGCDGSWAQARWQIDAAQEPLRMLPEAIVSRAPLVVQGWATGACNIQETTCDGLFGDRPPALTRGEARRSD